MLLICLLLVIASVPLASAGCSAFQTSPRQGYAEVNDAFIAATTVLIAARDTKAITEEEWNKVVLPLINLGNDLLIQYDAVTEVGVDGTNILLQVNQVLTALEPFVARLQ
jgi:hypothetical protein